MQNYITFACEMVPGSQCVCYRALLFPAFPVKDQVSGPAYIWLIIAEGQYLPCIFNTLFLCK